MVQQMTELKPCPFCGGSLITYRSVRDGSSIGCTECGVRVARHYGPLPDIVERLETAWNTRTPPQVKPLVWQRNGNHWAGGHGYVVQKFGSEFTLTVRNQFDRNFPTVEAAKEAAQADYTLRIMEALV